MTTNGPTAARRGIVGLPPGVEIASYATYLEAQRAVDHLSDEEFPVQHVSIVGSGLRSVEKVTGRLSYPRVALAGALSGVWFGLFVGLFFSIVGDGSLATIVSAALIGAGFGMLFGVISYAATGGRRDFSSVNAIVASRYTVLCADQSGRARELLHGLKGVQPLQPPPPATPQAPADLD